ncbi:DegT/DnrJ/EryC1/StrS family aminotransferase [Actinokineospora cianjurensis]|uniref:Perosamine synthetase n=1 Tax=Actinokineospora cianjurensis TaxID=585224 RepID=A0A421B265_9PSEU|nr:DegT/DnrJ/EryC1/StrS family aminotransferase [Actinokineospora cianjurensis]RLK58386.1 perosamine synthetase [Actinokineospora cianjurensis]
MTTPTAPTGHPAAPDPVVEIYERRLAARLGVEHVVAVSSGTAALHCALAALGVGPGTEVLVPALTVIMSAAPVAHLGARPVFVDCLPDGDLDPHDATAKTTPRTAAIMQVQLWGRTGNQTLARALADRHGLPLVVDSCQALGSTVDSHQAGLHGDVACFSTHDLKLLRTGEGGFLTTDNPTIAAHARAYRSHGHTPDGPAGLGHNYRLAAALAHLGLAELDHLDDTLAHRVALTTLAHQLLAEVPGLEPVPADPGCNHYAPLARITLPRPRAFAEHLATRGVPNSTGTFGLVPLDHRPQLADTEATGARCATAAEVLEGILALVLTHRDDEASVRRHVDTIAREVARWTSRH